MTATIIGTTSVATGGTASTSSPSAAMPAGTQGQDLLLAFHAIGSSSDTVTFPAGWSTPVRNTGATGVGDSFSWKIASGSAGSATTESALVVSSGSARNHAIVLVAIRLTDNTSPIVATASSTITPASTTKTCPGATAAGDILEVNFVTDHPAGSTSTVSNWVAPSGFTVQGSPNATQNGFVGTSIAVGTNNTNPTTTGSMPTRAWTTSLNCLGSAWSVAVKATGGGAPAPVLDSRVVGVNGKVKVKTTNATSVRLKVGTDTAVTTGVTFTSAQTPDANGYTMHDVSGLAGNSVFYYRVAMTDSASAETLDAHATVGRIKTKATGSFNFCIAACCNSTDSASMTAIANRADDFFLHLGDLYYADGSGTGAANFRAKFDAKITATNHAAVFATTPSSFQASDHDGGMNNNYVGTGDTVARDNYNLVYRERLPIVPVPATTGTYHAFSWGRVRFVVMDLRSFKSANAATDNSSKTMLGATQKQWVKDEITNATEPVIILVGDVPWTAPTVAGEDDWGGYNTERQELVTHFGTVPSKKIGYIGGDMHAVAADNGTNSAGGIPTWQAAPLNNSASIKGGPYTAGPYPASGSAVVQQYGRMVVTDAGSTITFDFTGYSSDNTVRVTQSTVFNVDAPKSGSASGSISWAGSATGLNLPPAMPVGNLPGDSLSPGGWRQILAEDWNTDCAQGAWPTTYPNWLAYPNTWDNGHTSYYNGGASISVSNSILTTRFYTDGTGKHRTETIRPPVGQGRQQKYGIYEIAYRVPAPIPGYKQAFLLWPASNLGADGEIDYPEASFDPGSTIKGFVHEIEPPGLHANNAYSVDTTVSSVANVWHVCRIVWHDNRVEFWLDGVLQGTGFTNSTHVPDIEMTWRLQTEGNLAGTFAATGIDPATTGTLELAYAAVWEPIIGGSSTGSISWTGSATGQAPVITANSGGASGSISWAGSATGGAPVTIGGAVVGLVTWTGVATGDNFQLFFQPPTHEEPIRTWIRPLNYYRLTYAKSVVRVNGSFVQIQYPSPEVLAAAGQEGVDYFLGGRIYAITSATANELTAAGYTVT